MASALKCPSCSLRFDSPMLLPCGFTTCLRCLRRLAAEHPEYIMCSDCVKRHEVPDGVSVESFPVNKLIKELLDNANVGGPPGRPAPTVPSRSVELCSRCGNKTASFENCAHCSAIFCVFCFEKHIEVISAEVNDYVAAVEEHCTVAGQIVSFYSKMSSGMGSLTEREKRKEAVIEWGEQLKSLFIRAVGSRVGQLCIEVDAMIDEQSTKMTSLDDAMDKVQQIHERCSNIASELRSSARPNVPHIFASCAQVDEEIRSLEDSLDGLGMPYLDSEAVSTETHQILEQVKSLGKLVCDSKRTIEEIVATERLINEDGGAAEQAEQDKSSFYELLRQPTSSVQRDAQNKAFGAIWDIAPIAASDGSSRQVVVAHNRFFVTLVDANTSSSLATFELQNPSGLPDLSIDIKHIAVAQNKRVIYLSQNDRVGIFSMNLPKNIPFSAANQSEPVLCDLSVAVQGPGDASFFGIAVDERAKVIYSCDQFRSRVFAWSMDNGGSLASFATTGLGGDFKPFKCALSPPRAGGTVLMAISDYNNERVCILALTTPTVGQFQPTVINKGSVVKPAGVTFDAAGQLLVAEGPSKRIQVFSIMPDCQSVALFPSINDKLRSPRAVCVFVYGKMENSVVAVADNAGTVFFFRVVI